MTTIDSNGSKWYGEEPDSVPVLLDLLAREPLDPTFEEFGNFIRPAEDQPGVTRFAGGLWLRAHVFRIDTDDPEIVRALTDAIRAKMSATRAGLDRLDEQEREVLATLLKRGFVPPRDARPE